MTESSLPPALAEMPGFLIAKAHAVFHAHSNGVIGSDRLTIKHFGCLTVIAEEGPLSQAYLCERVRVDRTTMVAVVDELERLGAVERRRDPGDRRANALRLTASGRRLLTRARTAVAAAEEAFLAPLPQQEQRRLRAALRTLIETAPPA
jgi:DNA-binding MarR family transcriptional regulator